MNAVAVLRQSIQWGNGILEMVMADVTDDQADCLATKWDDAFVAGGGYKKAFDAGENGLSSMMMAVFGAMGECGVDLNFGDGSTP